MSASILVLAAHPVLEHSRCNLPLLRAAEALPFVTAVDLYARYPRWQIDVDREQQLLREHDVILLQFPLYWYSVPALLKQWLDIVFEHGFAYGTQSTALQGKFFGCAITAGDSAAAYSSSAPFSLRALLSPQEHTATFCGMQYLPPLALFDAGNASQDGRLAAHLACWQRALEQLQAPPWSAEQRLQAPLLNTLVDLAPPTTGTSV